MAEVSLLVMFAIIIVSGIVIFRIVKGLAQAILLTSAVAAVVLAVAGGFVAMDVIDLRNNFAAGDRLLLFSGINAASGQQVITRGMLLKGRHDTAAGPALGEGSLAVSGPELEKINEHFRNRDYEAIKGSSFKLIIAKEQAIIDALPGSVADAGTGQGQNLSRESALELLQASSSERAVTLSELFVAEQGSNLPGILSRYKHGSVYVYPETPVFKAVKILPAQLFEPAARMVLAAEPAAAKFA